MCVEVGCGLQPSSCSSSCPWLHSAVGCCGLGSLVLGDLCHLLTKRRYGYKLRVEIRLRPDRFVSPPREELCFVRSKSCHLQRLLHSIMDQTPLSTGQTVLCTHRAGFANGAKTSCCLDGSLPAVAPLLSLLPPCFLNRHFHLPNDPKSPQGTFSIAPAHFLHPPSWCLGIRCTLCSHREGPWWHEHLPSLLGIACPLPAICEWSVASIRICLSIGPCAGVWGSQD